MPGDHDIIDLAVLAEMVSGQPEKISGFAHKFVASTRADIAEIEQALERGDMAALGALAHRTKAPARMVGASGFSDLCLALEDCARNGNTEQAKNIVLQLNLLLQKISQQIEVI